MGDNINFGSSLSYSIDGVIDDEICKYVLLSNTNTYSTGETATKKETKKVTKVKNKMIRPVRVIFNDPATIVFWDDDTKTVVKCSDDDEFSEYEGFCPACTKKLLGNNSKIKKLISKLKA